MHTAPGEGLRLGGGSGSSPHSPCSAQCVGSVSALTETLSPSSTLPSPGRLPGPALWVWVGGTRASAGAEQGRQAEEGAPARPAASWSLWPSPSSEAPADDISPTVSRSYYKFQEPLLPLSPKVWGGNGFPQVLVSACLPPSRSPQPCLPLSGESPRETLLSLPLRVRPSAVTSKSNTSQPHDLSITAAIGHHKHRTLTRSQGC